MVIAGSREVVGSRNIKVVVGRVALRVVWEVDSQGLVTTWRWGRVCVKDDTRLELDGSQYLSLSCRRVERGPGLG